MHTISKLSEKVIAILWGKEIAHVSDCLPQIFTGAGCEAEKIPGY